MWADCSKKLKWVVVLTVVATATIATIFADRAKIQQETTSGTSTVVVLKKTIDNAADGTYLASPIVNNSSKATSPVSKSPVGNTATKLVTHGKLPLIVLHVGPGKTGTSSIQRLLTSNESESALRSDNYSYIGDNGGILRRTKSYHPTDLNPEIIDLLKDNWDPAHKLLGSNEFLEYGKPNMRKAWLDATQKYNWNLQVVVTYRRLYEWLPSKYNQVYKITRILNKVQNYGHRNWPGIEGDYKIPSLPEHLREKMQEEDAGNHVTVKAYENWVQDFPVSVFHYHQEGDMTTNFVCQVVPGATTLCDQLNRTVRDKGVHSNGSENLDYDRLGVAAWEHGLIHESDKRIPLSEAIEAHHTQQLNSTKLPRVCPDAATLEQIRLYSLEHERWAESFAHAKPISDFSKEWNKTMTTGKLCSMDVEATLELPAWKTFFKDRYEFFQKMEQDNDNGQALQHGCGSYISVACIGKILRTAISPLHKKPSSSHGGLVTPQG